MMAKTKTVTAVKVEPKKLSKLDMGVALFGLAEGGVKTITMRYSGGGDSGSIEEVEPCDKDGCDMDTTDIKRWDEIEHTLLEWGYKRLQNTDGDWINNEGGSGIFIIQVPSGEYKLDHNINVIEDYDYDGTLSKELTE